MVVPSASKHCPAQPLRIEKCEKIAWYSSDRSWGSGTFKVAGGFGKVDVCNGLPPCRPALRSGQPEPLVHYSSSLRRFLQARVKDRGEPRLAKTVSVTSHGHEDTWTYTLREKSVVKTEHTDVTNQPQVTWSRGSPSSSGNEPRAESAEMVEKVHSNYRMFCSDARLPAHACQPPARKNNLDTTNDDNKAACGRACSSRWGMAHHAPHANLCCAASCRSTGKKPHEHASRPRTSSSGPVLLCCGVPLTSFFLHLHCASTQHLDLSLRAAPERCGYRRADEAVQGGSFRDPCNDPVPSPGGSRETTHPRPTQRCLRAW